jgi:ribose/xylose/arabinose/galactoside ABC-type transport system permease subunit
VRRAPSLLRGQLRNLAPFATLIVLVAFFWAPSDSFATLGNLEIILTQISVTAIIAVGLTFVILCAEIDLSVASIANATGIVVASFTAQDASVNIANVPLAGWAAIPIALASCVALGGNREGRFVLRRAEQWPRPINIDSFLKILIRGLILLIALVINVYAQRMRTAGET